MTPSPRRTLGFTLVELIVIILLLGILSAYAASRYSGTSSLAALTSQQEILASLRLTQNRAMQRTGFCNRWVLTANQAGPVSTNQSVANCAEQGFEQQDAGFFDAKLNGVNLAMVTETGQTYLDFDSLGRVAQCGTEVCTISIFSATDQRQVCINREGYIYACEAH